MYPYYSINARKTYTGMGQNLVPLVIKIAGKQMDIHLKI
jgi:hypothetical protein